MANRRSKKKNKDTPSRTLPVASSQQLSGVVTSTLEAPATAPMTSSDASSQHVTSPIEATATNQLIPRYENPIKNAERAINEANEGFITELHAHTKKVTKLNTELDLTCIKKIDLIVQGVRDLNNLPDIDRVLLDGSWNLVKSLCNYSKLVLS